MKNEDQHSEPVQEKSQGNNSGSKPDAPEQATPISTDSIEHYLHEGTLHFHAKEYQEALDDFNKVIESSSNIDKLTTAHRKRALTYDFLGQCNKALGDLTWIIEHGKGDAGSYSSRGSLNIELGHIMDAINDFTLSYQINPHNDILLQRALAYYRLKQYSEAITDLTQILNSDENHPKYLETIYHHRGKSYFNQGRHQEALDDFNQIMKIQGKDALIDASTYIDMTPDGKD